METEIKGALIALFTGMKAADADAILAATSALDGIVARERDRLHPQLLHFLEKRSYAKAQMWLDGAGDIPAGICGGGKGRGQAS